MCSEESLLGACVIALVFKITALGIYIHFWNTSCLSCEEFSDTIPNLALAALVFSLAGFIGYMCDDIRPCSICFLVIEWILNLVLLIVAAPVLNRVDRRCDTNTKNIKESMEAANVITGVFVVGEPVLACILCWYLYYYLKEGACRPPSEQPCVTF